MVQGDTENAVVAGTTEIPREDKKQTHPTKGGKDHAVDNSGHDDMLYGTLADVTRWRRLYIQ